MRALAATFLLCACPTLPGIEDAGSDAGERPPFTGPAIDLAAGVTHACATMADGTVRCWGCYCSGALLKTLTSDARPVVIPNVTSPRQLALGLDFSCALMTDRTVKCWGLGTSGQLGDGNGADSDIAVTVVGLSDVLEISAGDQHVCARLMDGSVSCWGDNRLRQLGDGTVQDQKNTPSTLGVFGATQLDMGRTHSCARRASGTAVCWGDNEKGQLGELTHMPRNTPTPVIGAGSGTAVSAGANSCLLRDEKTVACWGDFSGWPESPAFILGADDAGIAPVDELSVGSGHLCVRLADAGTVACAGANTNGQLGDGTTTSRTRAVVLSGVEPAKRLALGVGFSCALREDGGVWCWGKNDVGQLGDSKRDERGTPSPVRF